jgi:hypothetical protein
VVLLAAMVAVMGSQRRVEWPMAPEPADDSAFVQSAPR